MAWKNTTSVICLLWFGHLGFVSFYRFEGLKGPKEIIWPFLFPWTVPRSSEGDQMAQTGSYRSTTSSNDFHLLRTYSVCKHCAKHITHIFVFKSLHKYVLHRWESQSKTLIQTRKHQSQDSNPQISDPKGYAHNCYSTLLLMYCIYFIMFPGWKWHPKWEKEIIPWPCLIHFLRHNFVWFSSLSLRFHSPFKGQLKPTVSVKPSHCHFRSEWSLPPLDSCGTLSLVFLIDYILSVNL